MFIIFVTMTIFSFSLYGQEDTVNTINLDGKYAIMFQVTSSFSLRSFEGQLFSAKKMIDNEQAWRLGVSLSGYHREGDNIGSDYTVYDASASQISLSLSFSKQNYMNSEDFIRLYTGLGLRVRYDHSWGESNFTSYSNANESISMGPIIYIGIEWFFTKRMSLSGEYGGYLYYRYNYYSMYSNSLSKDVTSSDQTIGFSQDDVKLGISVYF
ncbi:MAG: hypothetical protein EPO24_00490 [Bacteroidetes bacterium]|nr:MAG: hypothetical protein EPO24_00490 [Bacteroidota bacterium]